MLPLVGIYERGDFELRRKEFYSSKPSPHLVDT